MTGYVDPPDLEPAERGVHRALASAPPRPLPFGFRDAVMTRVRRERRVTWEWIVAVVLALPNLAFLARQVAVHGQDFAQAIGNIVSATSAETSEAFFAVDGLTIVALALLGISCALAAHALANSATTRLSR